MPPGKKINKTLDSYGFNIANAIALPLTNAIGLPLISLYCSEAWEGKKKKNKTGVKMA